MDYIAGLDGGGTKTTLICSDLDGNRLLTKKFGAFNLNSIGTESFERLLLEICHELNNLGNCLSFCIGAAGISNENMQRIIDQILAANKINNYQLVGDHIIALEGAHCGNPGLAVIAGTGSICFGKGSDGSIERTGGWGHLIGDDGSAYGIGRDIFKECAKTLDGYGKETILVSLLADRFSLHNRKEIIEYVYSGDKSAIADVAVIIDEAHKAGDKTAMRIVSENAEALSESIIGVARKLKLDKANIALFGGLIDKATPFRDVLMKLVYEKSNLSFSSPKLNAAEGAVLLARKALKKEK